MTETSVPTPSKSSDITKIEAVRRALANLSADATRTEVQTYVKQHFGFDMTLDHISNTKNKLQAKAVKGKAKKPAAATPAVKPAAPKAPAPKPLATAAANGKATTGIRLEDIESVKSLVSRVGPEQLRSLVSLLSK